MGKLSEDVTSKAGETSDSEKFAPVTSITQWSPEEERALVRKIDFRVMPLLILVFFALQMDRGNIGNALTDFFFKDVGITQDQFNVGQQLLSLGIVLLEIPSNLVLYRIGPRLWLSGQVFCWGLVATFQAFQHGVGAFMATRLLLGLLEAGFIPAGFYCITMWYRSEETSKRFSIFFVGNQAAVATTSLIAYGILQMRGICNLAGWQWMFLIEGMFTIVCGLVFAAFFPDSPANPVPLLRINYFTPREKEILKARLLDDPSKLKSESYITKGELKEALLNWRVWPHFLATLTGLSTVTTLNSYAPTLVNSFGFARLRSNALTSVGGWIVLCVSVATGFLADKTHRRGLCTLGPLVLFWIFCIASYCSIDATRDTRYALLTLAISFSTAWHPVHGSWLALNARTAGERSIRMALFIMGANAAGIIGSQTFRSSDAPKYHIGWAVIVALDTFAVIMIVFQNVQYRLSNKRLEKTGDLGEEPSGEGNGIGEVRKYEL